MALGGGWALGEAWSDGDGDGDGDAAWEGVGEGVSAAVGDEPQAATKRAMPATTARIMSA